VPTSYDYDARGRLVSITQGTRAEARTTSLSYDGAGHLAGLTDPFGRTTSFKYDAAGRVITQTLPDGRVVGYAYDANGNLTALTPPGRPAHTFTYTPAAWAASPTPGTATTLQNQSATPPVTVALPSAQLSAYLPPDVGAGPTATRYTYNADQHLTEVARPDGQAVGVAYDNAGRLATLTLVRGQVAYTYDAATGILATITTPEEIALTYNFDGSLLPEETWAGAVVGDVRRTYDDDLRLRTLTIAGGEPLPFEYDPDSLLAEAGAMALSRNPQNGLLTGSTLGGVTDAWAYNGFAEPIGYAAGYGGTSLYAVRYTRDPLGCITEKRQTIDGVTRTDTYTYDVAGRLMAVARDGTPLATYTYDRNGNRLTATSPRGTVTGRYDAQDRLLRYGPTTYTHTANGELRSRTTRGQTTTYDYDALGNLLGVSLPDGTQITYLVDGRNRRLGKQVNGTLVQGFLYQDDLRLVAELDGTSSVISRFVYASRANVPDYLIKGGTVYRLLADHLGSPRLVVNTTTGEVVQRLDYDEFGRVLTDTNPGFQPFGFAGGLYDRDSGLIRFGARDYDAETGRWTTKDPTLFFTGGDKNLYGYVVNDPINLFDPFGLVFLTVFISNGYLEIDPENGRPPYVVPITTGLGACQNDPRCADRQDVGPIPPGQYIGQAGNFSEQNPFKTVGQLLSGRGDWGSFRLPLTPYPGTNTGPRGGFYLHGGLFVGTKGCIDIGGGLLGNPTTWRLIMDIQGDPDGIIPVLVLP
jgi:RHS repeat-associated protein